MVKFEKLDRQDWQEFRMETKQYLSPTEFELISQLHSKYYKHNYYRPCTCSPVTIKNWIKDLNIIWDNGHKED